MAQGPTRPARGFFSRIVARVNERVDRDADPEALFGRSISRRGGSPLVRPPLVHPQPHEQSPPGSDRSTDGRSTDGRSTDGRSTDDRRADHIVDADGASGRAALEGIRADQQRRMRRGSFGRRVDPAGE